MTLKLEDAWHLHFQTLPQTSTVPWWRSPLLLVIGRTDRTPRICDHQQHARPGALACRGPARGLCIRVPYLVSGRGADRVMAMQHAIDEIDPDGLRAGEHMRDSRAVQSEQRRSLAERASRTIGGGHITTRRWRWRTMP